MQLRRTVSLTIGGVWGGEPDGIDDLAVARVADFDMEGLTAGPGVPTHRRIDLGQRGRRLLRVGDLLLEKSGGGEKQNVGRVVQWTGQQVAVCSNFVNVLRPESWCDSRYLTYLHRSLYEIGWPNACTKQTTGIQNLDVDAYLRVAVPGLPGDAQRRVGAFLDRECVRIGSALGRAREVPAALDDHVRQWIRVQPEYVLAEQVPLKRLTKWLNDGPFGSALTSDHYAVDYGVRVVRLGNIGRGVFRTDDDVGVSQEYGFGALKPWLLDPDDLVLAALGDDNHPLGRAAVVPTSVLPAVNKADCYRVSCDRQVCDPSYLAWALSHGTSFDYAPVVGRGATRLRLTTETAKEIPVPVPTLADQIALMERLRRVRAPAEAGRRWSHRLSEALTAYRSSLIHEAVTGKLDVTAASDRQMDERLHAAAEGRLDEVPV